jgi:hypothetical protein
MKSVTMFLVAIMLVQSIAFGAVAIANEIDLATGGLISSTLNPSGITSFNGDEVAEQLRDDFFKSLNKDLVMRIEDYELSGPVDVIITFSDNSLVSA